MLDPELKLAVAYQMLRPVRVAVLKDLGRIPTNEGWERLSRGEERELPYWIASALQGRGFVEIREQRLSDVDIGKHLVVEKSMSRGELSKLKENFYFEARELMWKLKEHGGLGTEKLLQVMRLEADFKDIITLRLNKIVNIVLLGAKLEDYDDSLLVEEKILFQHLGDLLSSWVKGVVEGGGTKGKD